MERLWKEVVKVKLKFTLEQATKDQRETDVYSSTLPSTSALDGGGWSRPRPGWFTPGKDRVPIVQEARWAPGPVWTGAENLAPHRDSTLGPSKPVASRYTDCAIPAPKEAVVD